MKKLILTLAAAFLMITAADAQLFQFGIKGGLGMNKINIEEMTVGSGAEAYDLVTGDNVVGYHVGIQTRIKIAMLFIQPELYFNDGGGSLEQVVDNGPNEIMNIDFKRIDLPILVGVKLGPARLGVGPVGSYVVKDDIVTDISNIGPDASIFHTSMTWGFQAGLGIDLSKITFDVRYEGSLSKLGDSFDLGGSSFNLDARPSQWLFSVGFMF